MPGGSRLAFATALLVAVASAASAAADDMPSAPLVEAPREPWTRRDFLVRPLLGVGPTISDGGLGLQAQLGIRLQDALLRLSAAGGIGWHSHVFYCDEHNPSCATPNELYVLRALHADYLALEDEDHKVLGFVGIGLGRVAFGSHPTDELFSRRSIVLIPEAGIVVGHRNIVGRLLLDVQFLVPLSTAGPLLPTPGENPSRPVFLLSLLGSL